MAFFTSDQIAAFSKGTVRVDFIVKMEFLSSTVYVWNGHYPLTIGGDTYEPMHGIGQIDNLGTLVNTESSKTTLTVSGLPAGQVDFLAKALEETPEANQQLCTISVLLFDADWQPIGSPIGVFWGFMQPPRVEMSPIDKIDGGTQQIQIDIENAFFNRARPPFGRLGDRDQQKRSDGDLYMQFVSSMMNKKLRYPDF